jgi:hypothetical protein
MDDPRFDGIVCSPELEVMVSRSGTHLSREPCQAPFSLGAIWGFTTAKDRNLRVVRI